jgi:hypothetical protein
MREKRVGLLDLRCFLQVHIYVCMYMYMFVCIYVSINTNFDVTRYKFQKKSFLFFVFLFSFFYFSFFFIFHIIFFFIFLTGTNAFPGATETYYYDKNDPLSRYLDLSNYNDKEKTAMNFIITQHR